jgi:tRNA splicing ligase
VDFTSDCCITELNKHITRSLKNEVQYRELAQHLLSNNQTPIFEYISVDNPNVIRYPKQQLVLLAVRDNITGIYMNHWNMRDLAIEYRVPGMCTIHVQTFTVLEVIPDWPCPREKRGLQKLKEVEGVEGFIIKMRNGELYKLKTRWYWDRYKLIRYGHKFKEIDEDDEDYG